MFQWRTGEPPIRIIEKSTKVWGNVIEVIEDAREELVLVSPYNEYSVPLDEALKKAAEKGIPITAVCREEQKNKEDAHFKWLMSIGADVYLCRRLHAKIYYNESTAIVTSMNLLKSSATDSKEFGFVIKDATLREEIRNYVRTELLSHSKQVAPRQPTAPKPPAARRPKAEPRQSLDRGFCIRCREGIPTIRNIRCAARTSTLGTSTKTLTTPRSTATAAGKSGRRPLPSRSAHPATRKQQARSEERTWFRVVA